MASTTFKPSGKNDPMDQVMQAGSETLEKAKDTAASVGDMAKSAVEKVGEKADNLTASAGHELKAAGDSMAHKLPHEGMTGHASQAIAESLQHGGKYIEDAKLSGMANDLTDVIKTHPIPTMLICLGIGFVFGRAMRD
jgi:hypothetical protein